MTSTVLILVRGNLGEGEFKATIETEELWKHSRSTVKDLVKSCKLNMQIWNAHEVARVSLKDGSQPNAEGEPTTWAPLNPIRQPVSRRETHFKMPTSKR